MDLPVVLECLGKIRGNPSGRADIFNPYPGRSFFHGRLRSHPDNIVNGIIVAEEKVPTKKAEISPLDFREDR